MTTSIVELLLEVFDASDLDLGTKVESTSSPCIWF